MSVLRHVEVSRAKLNATALIFFVFICVFTRFPSGDIWLASGFRRFAPRRKVVAPILQKTLWA